MRPRTSLGLLIALALIASAPPAEAQPIGPRTIEDTDEEVDEVAPQEAVDDPEVGPEAPVEESLEDTGELEADPPDEIEAAAEPLEAGPVEGEPLEADAPEEPVIDEARQERRRISAQAALEAAEPRPSLAEVEAPTDPPWRRRLEIGAHFAFVFRPFADGVVPSPIEYDPAPGFGIHLHWNIVDWLRFSPYFLDSHHGLDIPPGALTSGTAKSISPTATYETDSVVTFSFGAKLQPTWNIHERLRTWLTAGVGWGRFKFREMTISDGDQEFLVFDRSGVFVEFPLGAGISVDVIERWLAIEYEAIAAPVTGQSGTAHEVFQAVNADGEIRDVGPFGAIEASFVQTLGLTLIL